MQSALQLAVARTAVRADLRAAAYAAHRERVVLRLTTLRALPTGEWINPPTPQPFDDVSQ